MEYLFSNLTGWGQFAIEVLVILVGSLILHRAGFAVMSRIARRTHGVADKSFLIHARRPTELILPVMGILFLRPPLPVELNAMLSQLGAIILIGSISWLLVSCTNIVEDVINEKYNINITDTWQTRQVQTQVKMLRRIAVSIIWFVTFAMMLMTFPSIRQLGTTLFASAGIVGVIIGIACRPALSNLISGLQLALTEPIRIKDLICVDGETGTVEEIGMTYVVVRTWDLRAFIVPLSYFIEKTFQNWTYQGSDLIGAVFLYVDYDVRLAEMRDALSKILATTDLWDGKVGSLNITEATDRTLQLRVLVSACDSEKLGDLRYMVREKLIEFLQENFPNSMPKFRMEVTPSTTSLTAGSAGPKSA
ncbi:MAG: mechanosensitive ion channel domain-containing protein [Pseudomonadota bacterium]